MLFLCIFVKYNCAVMNKSKLLSIVVISLTFVFLISEILYTDPINLILRVSLLPLLTWLYCISVKSKNIYFLSFLIFYSIGQLTIIFDILDTSNFIYNLSYYVGNVSTILAYLFLILEIFKSINMTSILNKYPVHVMILFVLDIYSVYLVTEITINSGNSTILFEVIDIIIETVYNIVVMLLLSISLINYISRDSKKAMNLLLGSLCIVFSEIMQVASYYVTSEAFVKHTYIVLLVMAFTFYYLQSKMSYIKHGIYKESVLKGYES